MSKNITMPLDTDVLPGRTEPIVPNRPHSVLGTSLTEYPIGTEIAIFGMGCFWGVERLFWGQEGIFVTAVGYAGGETPNPTYEEVCTGLTAHNEVVIVVYWPDKISYQSLLKLFWEGHNPTLGMRQGNDVGTQYRSGIYCTSTQQKQAAEESKHVYQQQLLETEKLKVTTEIQMLAEFYFAEGYHQQYLAKNPHGYCNLQTVTKTGLPKFPLG